MARPHDQTIQSSYPAELDTFTHLKDLDDNHNKVHRELQRGLEAVQATLGRDAGNVNPNTVLNHVTKHEGLDKLLWQDTRLPQIMAPIVSSEYWGVYGDGSDETEAVQNCVTEATQNRAIIHWPGRIQGTGEWRVVRISDTINVPNACRMFGGRFSPISPATNFVDQKPLFSWPEGTLNTGFWHHGYLIDTSGTREGIAIRCSVQQTFNLFNIEIQGFDIGLKIRGQVGQVYGLDISGCNIGVLLNQDVKSLDFFNFSSVGCIEADMRYSVIGDNGTPGGGMSVGAPKFSITGAHFEHANGHTGICVDLESAAMVTIRDVYVTGLASPDMALLRMRDNVHTLSKYRSCYSIENVIAHGPSFSYPTNDWKAVQDDYRAETVMMQAGWGGVFMDKYFRREDVP